jgi:hypothetical protein
VLLRTEEAHAVAACAQAEGQGEEGEQVAGRADGDDDVMGGIDGGLLAGEPPLYAKTLLECGIFPRRIPPMRL